MDGRTIHGDRLKHLREQAGLHRRELAELIGCSEGHLKNVENAPRQRADRTGRPAILHHQLSAVLAHRARTILSKRLGYDITLDDFSTPQAAA